MTCARIFTKCSIHQKETGKWHHWYVGWCDVHHLPSEGRRGVVIIKKTGKQQIFLFSLCELTFALHVQLNSKHFFWGGAGVGVKCHKPSAPPRLGGQELGFHLIRGSCKDYVVVIWVPLNINVHVLSAANERWLFTNFPVWKSTIWLFFFFFIQSPTLESLAASAAGKDHFLQMVLTHFLLISTMSVIKLNSISFFFFLLLVGKEGSGWD